MSEQPDQTTLSPDEAAAFAEDAFVFGMPLVYIAVQIETASNLAKLGPGRAPLNQIGHPSSSLPGREAYLLEGEVHGAVRHNQIQCRG